MTDSLPVCVQLRCKLQGQASEGGAGDLSLRIELISLVSSRPLLLFFLCLLSYVEGEEHFSHILADAVHCLLEDTPTQFMK